MVSTDETYSQLPTAVAVFLRWSDEPPTPSVASSPHAGFTRKAFLSLSGLMAAMQQELAAERRGEIAEVRRAAEAVRPEEPLLDQRAYVQESFDRSVKVGRLPARRPRRESPRRADPALPCAALIYLEPRRLTARYD